jgi:hypothetical protein
MAVLGEFNSRLERDRTHVASLDRGRNQDGITVIGVVPLSPGAPQMFSPITHDSSSEIDMNIIFSQ